MNDRLAKFFGVERSSEADFAKARVDDGKRAGVLTASLRDGVVCPRSRELAHPPGRISRPRSDGTGVEAAPGGRGSDRPGSASRSDHAPASGHADQSDRVHDLPSHHQSARLCLGALRRRRSVPRNGTREAGRRQRAATGASTVSEVAFDGARELAEFVAQSPEAHAAFTEQFFHHLVQQPARAYGPDTLDRLRESFTAGGFNIRRLAVQIMTLSGPRWRESSAAE